MSLRINPLNPGHAIAVADRQRRKFGKAALRVELRTRVVSLHRNDDLHRRRLFRLPTTRRRYLAQTRTLRLVKVPSRRKANNGSQNERAY